MDRQSSLVIVPESQRTEPPLGKPMVTFVFSSVFAERPQTFSITLNEHYALQLLNSLNEGRCIINTRKVLQWSNLIKNSTISICISIPSLSETLGSIQPLDPCAFIRLGPMQLLSDHVDPRTGSFSLWQKIETDGTRVPTILTSSRKQCSDRLLDI